MRLNIKTLMLTAALTGTLHSCSVQKKQYYIFDRYIVEQHDRRDTSALALKSTVEKQIDVENSKAEASGTQPIAREVVGLRQREATAKAVTKSSTRQTKDSDQRNQLSAVKPRVHSSKQDGNMLLLAAAGALGAVVFGLTKVFKGTSKSLTRWARANPTHARNAIALMQVPLLATGVMTGYSLHELGYEVSPYLTLGFAAVSMTGFLAVPFLPKREMIAIPAVVNRRRLAYTGIAISSLLFSTSFGNRITPDFGRTAFAQTINTIDKAQFAAHVDSQDTKASGKDVKRNRRLLAVGISAGGAALLITLLVIFTCAGACLTVFGVVALVNGELGGIAALLAGFLITWLSVRGIRRVSEKRRETKAQKG